MVFLGKIVLKIEFADSQWKLEMSYGQEKKLVLWNSNPNTKMTNKEALTRVRSSLGNLHPVIHPSLEASLDIK